jgi:hypothetical protein
VLLKLANKMRTFTYDPAGSFRSPRCSMAKSRVQKMLREEVRRLEGPASEDRQ